MTRAAARARQPALSALVLLYPGRARLQARSPTPRQDARLRRPCAAVRPATATVLIGSDPMSDSVARLEAALAERFGEAIHGDAAPFGVDSLARMAEHRVCRHYAPRDVAPDLVRL